MEVKVYDYKTNELITQLQLRKNSKHATIIDKVKEKLKEVYNYTTDFRILPTGSINYATGTSDIHYICFGIKKDIRIEF